MLERAVLHLETHYRHPDSLTTEFKEAGYCRSLPEKAFKEIHGDIYSQIDLSQLVRELKEEVIRLEAINVILKERLARLEEKLNSS